MKYVFMVLAVFMVGCTSKPLCEPAKSGARLVADAGKQFLGCTHPEEIQADIEKLLVEKKLCDGITATSLIGDLICGPAVDGIFGAGLSTLPAKYGCVGGDGTKLEEFKQKAIELCKSKI
jgi:hypothetical protein